MTPYDGARAMLRREPRRWLVTGVAGFIGSNLLESLLGLGQRVTGIDNFATGFRRNLEEVRAAAGAEAWSRFTFIEGDIRDTGDCRRACEGVDIVLHQAAVGSVPRSIADPLTAHAANATGFLNMLVAARDAGVARFVFASSSSVYGDSPELPKVEGREGRPLSPYAVTKRSNELYADVFARTYGMSCIGLRYFNVFGRRQDPLGAYAAVIPTWFASLMKGEAVTINGDGETTRDFCHAANAVQANLLAATVQDQQALNQIYNIAVGEQITLLELAQLIRDLVAADRPAIAHVKPVFRPFREGDVRHSRADIGKAQALLGYAPSHDLRKGLAESAGWYRQHLAKDPA